MTQDASSIIQSIDLTQVTAVARLAAGRDALQIRDWRVDPLGGGLGNPVSVGLYRFAGEGEADGEPIAWSAVLKILQSPANAGWVNMGEGDDPSHWNYWQREPLIYQSGLLDALPAGMAAPRCYGSVPLPGNFALLWLEDIHDAYQTAWPLARYALAARHLGELNGRYASGGARPSFPWFGRQISRQWAAFLPHWRDIPWAHPRVRQRYPQPEVNSFRRLLLDIDRVLDKLDELPQTICHGDTYPTNFMSRYLPDGREQTVALDWALMSIDPVGADLGQLVFGAQTNLPTVSPEEVTHTLFAHYLAGLRQSGCHVDPQQVRVGFNAFAALRIGLFQLYLLGEVLSQSELVVGEVAAPTAVPDCFEVLMAAEAGALLAKM